MRVHRSKEILHLIPVYSCIIILSLIPLSDNFELISPLFVIGNVGQDVILPCHVNFKTQAKLTTIQWNKRVNSTIENIYQFTASVGEAIYGQNYTARAVVSKEGLNTGDVSLKLKKVQMFDEGSYSCSVKSSEGWADQVQIVLQVEKLGGNSSTPSCLNWALPLLCILTLLLLVLIAGFVFYCKRKEKQMKAQMKNSENNPNPLVEQPQENRVLLSPFKIQDTQDQLGK
ncbi:uncharacterized protein LOC134495537 isoform X2 [Candoia aspera]|uniref:uncharacterized protein LOC134495537 isoform X2 n=1 Tax=Candoia aspera TaxID=51853 RepID=UPI002FD8160D